MAHTERHPPLIPVRGQPCLVQLPDVHVFLSMLGYGFRDREQRARRVDVTLDTRGPIILWRGFRGQAGGLVFELADRVQVEQFLSEVVGEFFGCE